MQHLLWFSKQQDAANARERHATAIANLTVAFESLQADVRAAEAKQEALRAEHYAAGDALHEKQGAFYEANAEVTRLEQQLAFARESETRITQQVGAADRADRRARGPGSRAARRPQRRRGGDRGGARRRAKRPAPTSRPPSAALPALRARRCSGRGASRRAAAADRAAPSRRSASSRRSARITRSALAQLAQRRERLESERRALARAGHRPDRRRRRAAAPGNGRARRERGRR